MDRKHHPAFVDIEKLTTCVNYLGQKVQLLAKEIFAVTFYYKASRPLRLGINERFAVIAKSVNVDSTLPNIKIIYQTWKGLTHQSHSLSIL